MFEPLPGVTHGVEAAWLPLITTVPLSGAPGSATGALIGAVDESASRHAHKAAVQMPTVANRLAAMPTLRNLTDRLGVPRCFRSATCGFAATASVLIT